MQQLTTGFYYPCPSLSFRSTLLVRSEVSIQSATCKLRGGLKCPHFDPQSEGEDSPSFSGRSNECYQCFQDVVVADSLEDGRRFARGPNDGGNK
jgi:hypothetical protein